jgi:hypothetical protein
MPSSGVGTTPGATPYINPNQVKSEAVRATGSGPFDSAYRQNLATYAGGQLQRPNGLLSFNPTAQPGQAGALGGVATGGGNAPVQGAPNNLITLALGGQGYATPTQPTSQSSASTNPQNANPIWKQPDWQQWLNQLTNQGGLLRGY